MSDPVLLEWITQCAIDATHGGHPLPLDALAFLVRRYASTDRADIGAAIDRALELDAPALDPGWAGTEEVDEAMRTIGNCLDAASLFGAADIVPSAVEALERIVGMVYEPGEGMGHFVSDPDRARGRLGDQVRSASTLLRAFAVTGRLPYSMLAEELMQFSLRTLGDVGDGGFFDAAASDAARSKPFGLNCEAARVLVGLEALRRDDAYRASAVVADAREYTREAERTLLGQASHVREQGLDSAVFGLALLDLDELESGT